MNNVVHEVDVEADTPLLWVLRDHLEYRGTKYGCGIGACGVCLVHFGDQPVPSCMLPIDRVGTTPVTTIEGLSGEVGDALRQAWIEGRVPQCGYCQGGQIMRAAALLSRDAAPDSETVRSTMSANLCRCGTYGRVLTAVDRAAALLAES